MTERPHTLPRILGATAVTLVGGTTLIGGQTAHANDPITVTNLDPSGPGSLSQALTDARNNLGPDTITFDQSVTGTITLTDAYFVGESDAFLPVINDDLTITGPGSSVLTIDADDYICRVFSTRGYANASYRRYDAAVEISGLTITNSDCNTIDIRPAAFGGSSLTLNDVVIRNSNAAAVRVSGTESVSITNSTFSDNGGSGLDISDSGSVILTTLNATGNGGDGAEVSQTGPITVTDSTFTGNQYRGLDIPSVYVSATITDVTASNNDDSGVLLTSNRPVNLTVTRLTADDNGGYGLYVRGRFSSLETTVVDSSFDRNENGVKIYGVSADLERVTISNSTSDGILVLGGVVTITNSTVTSSGGTGIAVAGTYDYTGYDDVAQRPTWDPINSEVTVTHATITGNTGPGISAKANGTIYLDEPYEFPTANDVTVDHSIVSGNGGDDVDNASETNAAPDQGTTTVTWSIVDEGSAHATGAGNFEADDPVLGELSDNGGETLTMLPAAGSPAIEGGDPDIVGAPDTDQRGVERVRGTAVDIGAVEAEPPTPVPTPQGATIDQTAITPGSTVTVNAPCKGNEKVLAKLKEKKKSATCSSPSTTAGLASPSVAGYTGIAKVEFDAPTTPGTYEITIYLVDSDETYVIPLTVVAPPTTTTPATTVPAGTLPATGSNGRTGLVAGLLAGLGTAMTLGASRRRRTN